MNVNFKLYREIKGISEKKIAHLLGISIQEVKHFEKYLEKIPGR